MTTRQPAVRVKRWLDASRLGLIAVVALIGVGGIRVEGQVMYWPANAADLARQKSAGIQCVNNLKQIGISIRVWAGANCCYDFPQTLQEIGTDPSVPPGDFFGVSGMRALYCPADVQPRTPTNWLQVDWSKIDYTMSTDTSGWDITTNAGAWCRIHKHVLQKDWFVTGSHSENVGWPAITAAPLGQSATPGSQVRFEVQIAPDAFLPLSYHWWRGSPFLTNRVFYAITNDPTGGFWLTNLVANLGVNNLPGATSNVLVIPNAQITDSDFYCVAVSNSMGTTFSYARLDVDPSVATAATNETSSEANCLNNLKQIALFGILWARDHDNHMPQSLEVMTNSYGSPVFGWPVLLYCRSDTNRTVPANWSGVNLADTSYEIVPGDETNPYAIFCRCKVHRNYAQMDGTGISRPQIRGIQRQANVTGLNLQIFAGRTNALEASTNLLNWTGLATYPSTNGIQVFYETNSVTRRFYRLRLQ